MSVKRILILGDSVSLGRPAHGIFFPDTWPGLLEAAGYSVHHRAAAGSTALEVLSELKKQIAIHCCEKSDFKAFDLVIFQFGIVDVTPRILPRVFVNTIGRYPPFSGVVRRMSRARWLIERFGISWVSVNTFSDACARISALSDIIGHSRLVISIAPPKKNLVSNCGDFSARVLRYNSILQESFPSKVIDFFPENSDQDRFLLADGHHLSALGHSQLYLQVLEQMKELGI